MNVDGKHFRTVWVDKDEQPIVKIIDQTKLPFAFEIENLDSVESNTCVINKRDFFKVSLTLSDLVL